MSNLQRALLWLAAVLVGFGPAAATAAQKLPLEVLMRMPPAQQKAYVKVQIAKQQLGSAPGSAVALDVTPPVLTYFNASSSLNLRLAQPPFNVVIKGTDDVSGISGVYFQADGPSGQYLSSYAEGGYPAKAFSGKGAFGLENRLLEPGVWTISWAWAVDYAGNYSYYDSTQLAALGNTAFTVSTAAYDVAPPSLVGGKILSPSVSLSSFARGTSDMPPFIGVKVDVTDTGNTGLGGLSWVQIELCLADESQCIYVAGNTSAGGIAAMTLSLRGSVNVGLTPGDYVIRYATLADRAGNFRYLESTFFGGSTDFSTLFPTTVITLTP